MVPASSGAAARAQGVGRPALNGNFRSVPTAVTRSKGLRTSQSLTGAAGVVDSVTVTESLTLPGHVAHGQNFWPSGARPAPAVGQPFA